MSRKILSVATLGLVKPKKKAAEAPVEEQKGPIIKPLAQTGNAASRANVVNAVRRRGGLIGGVGSILSDKLGA